MIEQERSPAALKSNFTSCLGFTNFYSISLRLLRMNYLE